MRLWLEVAELSDFQEKLGDQILWDEISQFLGYLQFISELKKMKKKSENSDFTEKIRVGPDPKSCFKSPESLILGWGRSSWTFWAQAEVCSC